MRIFGESLKPKGVEFMSSSNLNLARSNDGTSVFAPPFSPLSWNVSLIADTDVAIQIPFGVNVAIFGFSPGASVQVLEGGASDSNPLPTVGSFTQLPARLNPPTAQVKAGKYLHFISSNPDDEAYVYFYNNGALV
jgi:hypothetical protein